MNVKIVSEPSVVTVGDPDVVPEYTDVAILKITTPEPPFAPQAPDEPAPPPPPPVLAVPC